MKGKTEHTAGPWRTGDLFNTVFGAPDGNPSPVTIATVSKGNKANARLIAAAPELLEALKDIHGLLNPSPYAPITTKDIAICWDIAARMIAKATGESKP